MATPQKVKIFLKNTGDAPILEEDYRVVTINQDQPLARVITYIRNKLGRPHDPVFVYVRQSFCPSPDEQVGTLADSFGTVEAGVKKLTIHYSLTPAWG